MPSHKRFQPKSRDYSSQSKANNSKSAKTSKSSDKPTQPSPTTDSKPSFSPQELASQQKLLTILESAFNEVISSPDFSQTLQEVKSALFDRDFERAFGSEKYLDVYAARWSPTRVLGYASIFGGLRDSLECITHEEHGGNKDTAATVEAATAMADAAEQLDSLSLDPSAESATTQSADGQIGSPASSGDGGANTTAEDGRSSTIKAVDGRKLRVLALGGGAAELAALASYLSSCPGTTGEITLLDMGLWGRVTSKLYPALTTPPPLSKYAGAAAKASNGPLIASSQLQQTFMQRDILALSSESLLDLLGPQPLLVTLLFTLNELYTSGGIGRTTSFLRSLSREIAPRSLLLVVDSPGSYSEAAVGKGGESAEKKKYPMSWLVDHTLLRIGEKTRRQKTGDEENEGATGPAAQEKAGEDVQGCKWEKLEENDSVWFRVADSLRYPIQLENMRYQIHLYRAVSAAKS